MKCALCDNEVTGVGRTICDACLKKEQEMVKQKQPKTKEVVVYLHADESNLHQIATELNLSEEAFDDKFRGCCYEVGIRVEVTIATGEYKILGIKE